MTDIFVYGTARDYQTMLILHCMDITNIIYYYMTFR